jgi:hypothetical protein
VINSRAGSVPLKFNGVSGDWRIANQKPSTCATGFSGLSKLSLTGCQFECCRFVLFPNERFNRVAGKIAAVVVVLGWPLCGLAWLTGWSVFGYLWLVTMCWLVVQPRFWL